MPPIAERTKSVASPKDSVLPASVSAKLQRVLACVLCQQRKVKCDRKFPCANCLKAHAQCVPATTIAPRQRRRRFPERELLDRVRRYESLLRQHNINFEPLHAQTAVGKASPNLEGVNESDGEQPIAAGREDSVQSTAVGSAKPYEAKDMWHAMSHEFRDPDQDSDTSEDVLHEATIKKAWEQVSDNNDHLLFGLRKAAIDISALHPEQMHIFKLWQVYLDNVNSLLKVTHTPSLQGRIINAASNVEIITPTLAALMFGIYSVSILSLADNECRAMFGSPKRSLLARYQFGCQQALLNCSFLRSDDRECLTAFYLYLISVRPDVDAQSLSSMLGLAIRIGQRMGLNSMSADAKNLALEAEMRRRLWWSLVLFDTRVCEMAADFKSVTLLPTWDCKTPSNINDFELQPDMQDPPAVHGKSTEAIFVVVRSEISDFIRRSNFHLDFSNPVLKAVVVDLQRGSGNESGELVVLDKMIEDNYLKYCNPQNPLHFMTIWTARGQIAKFRLMETYGKLSGLSMQQIDAHRDATIPFAVTALECDTKLMSSPLTKGYTWLIEMHFPFPAYFYIINDLKRRPLVDHADYCWEIMSNNYVARSMQQDQLDNPFFKLFAKAVLQVWEAREVACTDPAKMPAPPQIIIDMRQKMLKSMQDFQNGGQNVDMFSDMSMDNFEISIPMGFGGQSMLYRMGGEGYEGPGLGNIDARHPALNYDTTQMGLNDTNWNSSMTDTGGMGLPTTGGMPDSEYGRRA